MRPAIQNQIPRYLMKLCRSILTLLFLGSIYAVAADEQPAPQAKRQGKKGNPEELFKKLDTNSDNAVSLEEFKAGAGGKRNPDRVDAMFKRRDKDGNGTLSVDEFKAQRRKKNKA
jgi:hypothetical protein